jgi:predicted enzyme related to lactoylglutathione lyase
MNKENQIDLIEFSATSSEELQKTKTFFTDVFGWQYKDYGDNYVDTKDSGVVQGINATSSEHKAPLAVLYTEDLEGTKAKVTQAGGAIVQDIFDFPGGRRFHFIDPANNELAVWSDK